MVSKQSLQHQDTIAAIATPPGIGGISVIRISGKEAIQIADSFFFGKIKLADAFTHTVYFGKIIDHDNNPLDDVLATVFHEPHSYTGENTIEISCHGGRVVTNAILSRIIENNVRHAAPGEFTKRAFINGRIDLAQAEAVADIIHAESEEAMNASLKQLEGKLSHYIQSIHNQLLHVAAILELSLDFAEDDVEISQQHEINNQINLSLELIQKALETYSTGRIIRDGLKVSLIGKPNTGKSSLLNAILGTKRAIVTDKPGTTRDFIEESINVKGNRIRFIDTAGLRETADVVENEGIKFSIEQLTSSDLVCDVIDVSNTTVTPDFFSSEINWLVKFGIEQKQILFVLNKSDLVREKNNDLQLLIKDCETPSFITSAIHNEGIEVILDWIAQHARSLSKKSIESDIIITNSRHATCLKNAENDLMKAKESLARGLTEEYIAVEVRHACDALSEIIGEVTSEDVLNTIFSKFCIGK